jgi:S1-C subfamily serine protease
VDQLMTKGEVRRGQLGVVVQQITTELAEALKLEDRKGVLVSDVQPGSAADRAGIRRGDVIVGINGETIDSTNELRNRIATLQPGSEVKVTIGRDGKRSEVTARLGEFQSETQASQRNRRDGSSGGDNLGISVQPLTPEIASQLGIATSTAGLVIRDMAPGSPAAEAGLRPGDVIIQANRKPVRSAAELQQAVEASGSDPVLLLINRGGRTVFVAVAQQR